MFTSIDEFFNLFFVSSYYKLAQLFTQWYRFVSLAGEWSDLLHASISVYQSIVSYVVRRNILTLLRHTIQIYRSTWWFKLLFCCFFIFYFPVDFSPIHRSIRDTAQDKPTIQKIAFFESASCIYYQCFFALFPTHWLFPFIFMAELKKYARDISLWFRFAKFHKKMNCLDDHYGHDW